MKLFRIMGAMLALAVFLPVGCSVPQPFDGGGSGNSSSSQTSTVTLEDVQEVDTSAFVEISAMQEESAVKLLFSEQGITSEDAHDCEITGTALKIRSPGTYLLSGTCGDGSVTVAKETEGIYLILKDLHLTSSTGPALTVNKSSSVCLYLAEGSENSLADASAEHTEGAALKFKSGSALLMGGEGSLTVIGNYKNGIKGGAASIFRILSGNLTVAAANNALACDNSLEIRGGTLNLTAQNDGIKASPDEGDTLSVGNIYLSGGTVTVKAEGDGISAEGYLELSGGSWNITTTGEIPSSGGGFGGGGQWPGGGGFPGGDFPGGGFPGGFPGGRSFGEDATPTASATQASDDVSSKGLKAGILKITGGELAVSSTDHALHCNGEAVIEGGTLRLDSSSAKGIATHGDLTVAGETTAIYINAATEGIESRRSFFLNGGTVRIEYAGDDGVNLGGTVSPSQLEEHAFVVNGGLLYCRAEGDGIDSNSTFTLNGGTVLVFGPSNGGNSCLDIQYTSTYNGGTVFAVATSGSMWNEVVGHTKGDYLYNLSVGTSDGDAEIVIYGADGSELISEVCPLKCSFGIYFMTDLTEDLASCTVKVDGKTVACTAGTGTGSSGGMGGFMPGGGGPGGGMRPGR